MLDDEALGAGTSGWRPRRPGSRRPAPRRSSGSAPTAASSSSRPATPSRRCSGSTAIVSMVASSPKTSTSMHADHAVAVGRDQLDRRVLEGGLAVIHVVEVRRVEEAEQPAAKPRRLVAGPVLPDVGHARTHAGHLARRRSAIALRRAGHTRRHDRGGRPVGRRGRPGSRRAVLVDVAAGVAFAVPRRARPAASSCPGPGWPPCCWAWPSPYAAWRRSSWSPSPCSRRWSRSSAGTSHSGRVPGVRAVVRDAGRAPRRAAAATGPRVRGGRGGRRRGASAGGRSRRTSRPTATSSARSRSARPRRCWSSAAGPSGTCGGSAARPCRLAPTPPSSRERRRLRDLYEQEQERGRIAADMHDLVAHSWAVVAAQADGAQVRRAHRPRPRAGGADGHRRHRPSAMDDVRVLLAQLREQSAPGARWRFERPDALVARMRASGMDLRRGPARRAGRGRPAGATAAAGCSPSR